MAVYEQGLRANLSLKSDKFQRGLKNVEREVDRFNRKTKGTSRVFEKDLDRSIRKVGKTSDSVFTRMRNKIGAVQALAVGFGATLALRVGKGLSDAGRDAEETRNKFQAVFKELTGDADRLVEGWRGSLGRGRSELQGMLATLQDTFVPMGMARDKAFQMSKQVSQLAMDLASFNNAADSEVVNLLTSALVGNHEAVRRYGISITAARLDQQLLAMGFNKATKGATEQQKMMARLALLMNDTNDAQGDLMRTQDSFANVQKRINAGLKEAREEIGEKLNKELLTLIEGLGGAAEVADKLATALKTIPAVTGFLKDLSAGAFKGMRQPGGVLQGVADMLAKKSVDVAITKLSHLDEETRELSASTQEWLDRLNPANIATRAYSRLMASATDRAKALASEGIKDLADEQGRLQTSITDTSRALEKQLKAVDSYTKSIEQLQRSRSGAKGKTGERVFSLGLAATDDTDKKIELIRQRMYQLQVQSEQMKLGGEFERARDSLNQVRDLVEQVSSLQGFENILADQRSLISVGDQIDQLFQDEIAAQDQLKQKAQQVVESLRSELTTLELKEQAAKDMAAALSKQLASLDTARPQELVDIFADLGSKIDGASMKLKALTDVQDAMGIPGGGPKQMSKGGVGDPRDTIPALLRPGETVLTPEHSRKLAPLLRQVGVPGYAAGGKVAWQQILQSTRSASEVHRMLKIQDQAQRLAMGAREMEARSGRRGFVTRIMSEMPEARAPEALASMLEGARGFARGGKATPSTSTTVGDVHIDFHSRGGTGRDALELGRELRRLIKDGALTLT